MKSIKWLIRMFLVESPHTQAGLIVAAVMWGLLILRGMS